MTPDPYFGMPGGRPAWPTIEKPVDHFPTRICARCQEEKALTKFAKGCKTCNRCYDKAARERNKALSLEPKRLFPIEQKHHMGQFTVAVAGDKA